MHLLLLFFLGILGTELYPYTLLSVGVECETVDDCRTHYNGSWCESAGILCVHRSCKRIPNHPCKSTQLCLEAEQRCEPVKCTEDKECDNGVYCDGTEICKEGHCETDVARPNCHYTGGECNEALKQCTLSKSRVAWRSKEKGSTLRTTATTTTDTNTSIISQLQVNVTALIVVAGFIFIVLLIILIYLVSRSIRAGYTKRRYT